MSNRIVNVNLRKEIVASGTSRREMSDLLGITYTRLNGIINGSLIPTKQEREDFSSVLGVSVDGLFDPEYMRVISERKVYESKKNVRSSPLAYPELKRAIMESGMSNIYICLLINMPHARLSKILYGTVIPNENDMLKLSSVLGVSVDSIFGKDAYVDKEERSRLAREGWKRKMDAVIQDKSNEQLTLPSVTDDPDPISVTGGNSISVTDDNSVVVKNVKRYFVFTLKITYCDKCKLNQIAMINDFGGVYITDHCPHNCEHEILKQCSVREDLFMSFLEDKEMLVKELKDAS